jgi:CRP-like cAMP-binding protein
MATNTTIAALANLDIFAGLSKKELAAIDRLMTPIDINAGKEFIKEGTIGREAFIIIQGDASVWHKGRLVASVGPGAIMGEIALLAGTPRSATVRAETAMTLEVLNRNEFSQLIDDSPGLARKLLTATMKRVQQLEPTLLG